MIPQSFIQELLARIDIVDVVERSLKLKKAGANYLACCPFHQEKSPSFSVSPAKQFYHCFGCGAHGSAIGFVMEYQGLGFVDAVEVLATSIGMQVPQERRESQPVQADKAPLTEIMAQAARFYREQLKASPKAIDYLKGRGLSGEIAARFGIGYAPDAWQGLAQSFHDYRSQSLVDAGLVVENEEGRRYDRFRDRIMFPIVDARGNTIGFGGRMIGLQEAGAEGAAGGPKYLNSPETALFEKGRELYGLPQARQAIRDADAVIVVEGYMDVLALAQFGIGNVVATLGTATTPTHVQKLIRQAGRVVFCFDGDAAGRKAAWRALEASLDQLADSKTVAFLFLPPEHDPDSYVRSQGAESFRAMAAAAGSLADFLTGAAKSRADIATAEGRSRLLHDMRPLLGRVKAPRLRAQLAHGIARVAGLVASPPEAERLLDLPPLPGASSRYSQPAAAARRAPPSLARVLLKIVLQKPDWSARLPVDLLPSGGAEAQALAAIADAVDHADLPAGGLGTVLEFFRATPHQGLLDEIVSELVNENFDETAMEAVFGDAVARLRYAGLTREIAALNAKERGAGLSPEERTQLARLLSLKREVAAGYASPHL